MHDVLLGVCLYFLSVQISADKDLPVLYSWKTLQYGFHSSKDREHAIKSGHYNKSDPSFPADVGVFYNTGTGSSTVFITIRRFLKDSPYSLARVSENNTPNGPLLYPYPSYDWHNNDNINCSAITAVFRIAINECGQMWVIDSGVIKGVQICPPQILAFDLATDTLIHRYRFSDDLYTANASIFINIKLDTADPPPEGQCENTMAYMPDALHHGLVVYSKSKREAWRIENKYMYPDPKWTVHKIDGFRFEQLAGIFAINLTPRTSNNPPESRHLYFNSRSSNREMKVPLDIINNKTIWENEVDAMQDAFKIVGTRNVQSVMEVIDSEGNLFFGTDDPLSVIVWNIYQKDETYNSRHVVANSRRQLQYVSGMKEVITPSGEKFIYILSSRYQKFKAGTFNPRDVNFRIMGMKTTELLSRVSG